MSLISEINKQAENLKADYEAATVKCGIIGLSGSGKSSLINAIAGEKIAKTGSTETTLEKQSYFHAGVEYVDLPGCGTQRFPQETYIKDLDLETYDCFMIITSNRLYESDTYLHTELIESLKKPCFIVRNKIDVAVEDEKQDNNLTEAETLQKVRSNIIEGLSPVPEKIYLTSARYPTKWDLALLINDIGESQTGFKRDKFNAGTKAWSMNLLTKKTLVARKVVSFYSVGSAANSLTPIPGADVAVDVALLVKMSRAIQSIYGLTENQLEYPVNANTNAVRQLAAKWVAKYAVAEGIILLLKAMGKRVLIKSVAKYLPFVGTAISAGIGYTMTLKFGEDCIDEAESIAKQLIEELLKDNK